MYKSKKISLVIPCFNEEKGIGYVLKEKPSFIDEVIVIDNNSSDGTAKTAKALGAKVVLEQKQGYGASYKTGFKETGGDIIVTCDGDGSYPLGEIDKVLVLLTKENYDFISCARKLKHENSLDGILRRFGNLVLNGIIFLLFGKRFKDSQSGMWVFKKKILSQLKLTSDGMAFSEEIKLEAFTKPNLKTKEAETSYHARIGKSKLKVWRDGVKNLFFIIKKRIGLKDTDLTVPVLILSLYLFILGPSFFLPWSLIDDGSIVNNSQKILSGLTSLDWSKATSVIWESGVGRFRPTYWFYNLMTYLSGGKNPFIYHLLRFVNFALVGSLIFAIAQRVGKSTRAGILSFLFFSFSFLTFENWYRLGPQEPLTTLFLGLAFYLILTKKIAFAFWPILFLFLLKETNIVLSLALGLLVILNQKMKILKTEEIKKLFRQTVLLGMVAMGLIFLVKASGSYSSYYQLDIGTLTENLFSYLSFIRTYFGYFPLIALAVFILLKKEKEEFFWLVIVLASSALFLATLLPWSFSLGRYLLPTIFFLAIFLGVEIDKILIVFKKFFLIKLILVFYILGILIQNGVIMAGTFYDYYEREKANSELISYLSNLPENSTVYLNLLSGESTIEYYEEAKLHLELFYGRQDIKLSYLEDINQPQPGDLILEGYLKAKTSPLPENFVSVNLIEKKFKTLIVTTPVGFAKRMTRWGINMAKGSYEIPDGIYTFYQGNYWWRIYQVKG